MYIYIYIYLYEPMCSRRGGFPNTSPLQAGIWTRDDAHAWVCPGSSMVEGHPQRTRRAMPNSITREADLVCRDNGLSTPSIDAKVIRDPLRYWLEVGRSLRVPKGFHTTVMVQHPPSTAGARAVTQEREDSPSVSLPRRTSNGSWPPSRTWRHFTHPGYFHFGTYCTLLTRHYSIGGTALAPQAHPPYPPPLFLGRESIELQLASPERSPACAGPNQNIIAILRLAAFLHAQPPWCLGWRDAASSTRSAHLIGDPFETNTRVISARPPGEGCGALDSVLS